VAPRAGSRRLGRPAWLLLLLLIAFPAAAKDELVLGIRQYPASLHPLITATVAKSFVLGMAARPINAYDKTWTLVCLLCEAMPALSQGSAVGGPGSARLALKPGLAWGDGVPITSRDIVFTWMVGRHPDSGVGEAELFRRIERIETIDERTVILHFNRVTYDFADLSGFILLPEHLERALFEADPKEYRNRTTYAANPTNPGLYSGPYTITQVVQGARLELDANRHWRGHAPAFRRIVIKTTDNTSALVANLLAGDIDLIPGEIGIGIDQAVTLEKSFPGRFTFLYKPALRLEHIDFNLDNPILADVRLRQALTYAIDRAAIVGTIFEGKHALADSTVSPEDRFHASGLPPYAYDPARANRLLDDTGWKRRGGDIRQNAAGEPLILEINSTAGDRARDAVLQTMQSQWRAVGVDVRIKNYPAQVLFAEILFKRKFPGMGLYTNVTSPDWVPRTIFHSAHVPNESNNWSGYNLSNYRNAEMDGIIERLEMEADHATREELWHRLQRRYAEDLPAMPLYFQATATVMPPWLEGLVPTGHNAYSTLWVEDWNAR
jgi:peptide/nickel transport system substrate-binding protein